MTTQDHRPEIDESGLRQVTTRTFDAPIGLVYRMHTEAEHLKRWWGPKGCTIGTCDVDLRPGGLLHFSMDFPDGGQTWARFIYQDIVPQRRLLFLLAFSDENGGITRQPGVPDWPEETLVEIVFEENAAGTAVTISVAPVDPSAAERAAFDDGFASMEEGFGAAQGQLAEYLSELN